MGMCRFKCIEQCQQAGNNELVKGEMWGSVACVLGNNVLKPSSA